jgi:hypothetical protein
MFSANENILLRQHKKRIVEQVESTIPEDALDMGSTVMVMQVSCKAPGCVPLETAIIIVFPASAEELIPGLPESKGGGSYKTKILKPMSDVTKDDVLEALPPAFEGGQRTMEKLCFNARDIMLGQITQLFGEEDETIQDRQAMAEYLQQCLQEYVAQNCQPPELGEAYKKQPLEPPPSETVTETATKTSDAAASTTTPEVAAAMFGKGNFVVRRQLDDEPKKLYTPPPISASALSSSSSSKAAAQTPAAFKPKHQGAITQALNPRQGNNISKLFDREHAPGIRAPGCPCCDPDNPSNILDNMMML